MKPRRPHLVSLVSITSDFPPRSKAATCLGEGPTTQPYLWLDLNARSDPNAGEPALRWEIRARPQPGARSIGESSQAVGARRLDSILTEGPATRARAVPNGARGYGAVGEGRGPPSRSQMGCISAGEAKSSSCSQSRHTAGHWLHCT